MVIKMPITNDHSVGQSLFSDDVGVRKIEAAFLPRLVRLMTSYSVERMQLMVNSGEFNEFFPLEDDADIPTSVGLFPASRPFDYAQWKSDRAKDMASSIAAVSVSNNSSKIELAREVYKNQLRLTSNFSIFYDSPVLFLKELPNLAVPSEMAKLDVATLLIDQSAATRALDVAANYHKVILQAGFDKITGPDNSAVNYDMDYKTYADCFIELDASWPLFSKGKMRAQREVA